MMIKIYNKDKHDKWLERETTSTNDEELNSIIQRRLIESKDHSIKIQAITR